MAKKPRVYEFRLRGDKKFVKENELLMLNVAKENGLAVWNQVSQSYVIDKITPELIALTKQKVSDTTLKATAKPAKQSYWDSLVIEVNHYDSVNNTNVWAAFKIWLDSNPQVKSLRGKERTRVCSDALVKMIKCMDVKLGLTPTPLRIKLERIAREYALSVKKENQLIIG